MEARTGLVVGGLTAVTVSVAVVSAVAFANTAALADSPGTTVASEQVVVPAAASPSATPQTAPTVTPDALTPSAEVEVVEAPAPVVVDPASPTAPVHAAPAPGPDAVTPAAPAAPAAAADLEQAVAAAKASGSWDPIRTWAAAHGWSTDRLDSFLSRLERESPAHDDSDDDRKGMIGGQQNQTDRTSTGADRPAHAGTNVGSGNGAGRDAKRDQSRNSPDERD